MKTVIIGAGAMGSLFAYKMQAAGQDVRLIGNRPETLAAVREHGIQVVGEEGQQTYPVRIYSSAEAQGEVDLLILFVKAMQLEGALQQNAHLIGSQTRVLCLLNGIGHDLLLKKYVPSENIFIGVTVWSAVLDGPGRIHHGARGNVELRELITSEKGREEARTIAACLSAAGLAAVYSEDILFSIWRKACINGTANTLCTLLEKNVGTTLSDPWVQEILPLILGEFKAAAAVQGVALDLAEMKDIVLKGASNPAVMHHFPSMYQDLILNHRRTEIDYLNGAVAAILAEAGQASPVCSTLTALIHAKENLLLGK